jgi:hypothetical protein
LTSKSLIQKKENGMPLETDNGRQLNEDENSRQLPEADNDRQVPATENGRHSQEDENSRPTDYTYNQFLRFYLVQSYDINEAKEDKDKKQPFSAIFGEIDLTPDSYYAMHVDATRSQYNSFWASYNVAVKVWDKRKDSLFVERRYRHSSSDSIFYDLKVVISDKLSVFADYERNRHTAEDIRKNFGFLYKPQCWALEANYTHEGNDRKYMFIVSLYGIGDFAHGIMGSRLENPYLSR